MFVDCPLAALGAALEAGFNGAFGALFWTIALFGEAEALLGATGACFGASAFGARLSFLSN